MEHEKGPDAEIQIHELTNSVVFLSACRFCVFFLPKKMWPPNLPQVRHIVPDLTEPEESTPRDCGGPNGKRPAFYSALSYVRVC